MRESRNFSDRLGVCVLTCQALMSNVGLVIVSIFT